MRTFMDCKKKKYLLNSCCLFQRATAWDNISQECAITSPATCKKGQWTCYILKVGQLIRSLNLGLIAYTVPGYMYYHISLLGHTTQFLAWTECRPGAIIILSDGILGVEVSYLYIHACWNKETYKICCSRKWEFCLSLDHHHHDQYTSLTATPLPAYLPGTVVPQFYKPLF